MSILEIETKYRPVPFWSWNDKLDPEELRHQIREMCKVGIGGFFMHARGGLQTKYMSNEWMDCINACLDEAGKLGMEAYLYDENGWPSGFGDGLVNGLGEDYQLKYLRWEKKPLSECSDEHTIGYYSLDCKFIGREKPAEYQGEIIRFYYEVNPFYVDNLDANVTKKFLEVIYEHYYKNIPAELLKHLRGVFTDEPQLSRAGIAWSFVLESEYQKAYNAELLQDLPYLFFDGKNSKKVRVRFWNLVAKLFSKNFMKQIYDWCDEHNWIFTGHAVLEDLDGHNIMSNGDIMSLYRYFHIPGVDHLRRVDPSRVAGVQLLSAAHQTGKKQLMSESFALCGWNFNFSGMHWLYQQQMATGINFLCPHLSGYTLRGLRKRDYPASLFCHQPWWDDYKVVNDYFARAGRLLAEGEEQIDLLVVHPLSTLHGLFDVGENDKFKEYIKSFYTLTRELSARHINFHYADEIYMEDYGSFDGKNIVIGECRYNYVLIPKLDNLSAKMIEVLMQFERNGGKVIKLKNLISDEISCDGDAASIEVVSWYNNLPEVDTEIAAAKLVADSLTDIIETRENGKTCDDLMSVRRKIKDIGDGRTGTFYLIMNSRYDEKCNAEISILANGNVIEVIDKESGRLSKIVDVKKLDNRLIFDYNFGAGEGIMLFVSDQAGEASKEIDLINTDTLDCVKKLDNKFKLKSFGEGNIITLDRCRYRVNDGEWISDEINVIHPRLIKEKKCCDLEMEIDFVIEDDFDLSAPITLISETPEIFKYTLNGMEFEAQDTGYLFDTAFRKITLPKNLRHGVNTLGVKCYYYQSDETLAAYARAMIFESEYNKLCYDTEIENFYLLGDFAVNYNGKIEELPRCAERLKGNFTIGKSLKGEVIDVADIVNCGFPFYSGKMVFEQTFDLSVDELEKINYLRFKGIGANSYRIKLNGKELGLLYMENYVVNIKDCLQQGVNILEIEVTTSLRNTLGPHHLEEGESFSVHTLSFSREACSSAWKCPDYNPDYAFVKVGLSELELV